MFSGDADSSAVRASSSFVIATINGIVMSETGELTLTSSNSDVSIRTEVSVVLLVLPIQI